MSFAMLIYVFQIRSCGAKGRLLLIIKTHAKTPSKEQTLAVADPT